MENISRLKELRESKALTQSDLALYLGMRQQQYSRYEIGKREIPLSILVELADFYSTSIDYILSRTDVFKPYKKGVNFPIKVKASKRKTNSNVGSVPLKKRVIN